MAKLLVLWFVLSEEQAHSEELSLFNTDISALPTQGAISTTGQLTSLSTSRHKLQNSKKILT